jgi:putative Mg2+ transporter-C (MgtC) family protein
LPLHPSVSDIAVRIALTLIAGAAIGYNREQHGRPAGLRTTVLVALAACVAMVQMNELLPVGGKTPSSFSVMDVMRLPLGILSGIGIIGAGVILRRGEMLAGVTTAATLWMATVVGLAMGGGQIVLGVVASVIAVAVLWSGVWLDRWLKTEHRGELVIERLGDPPQPGELNQLLAPLGCRTKLSGTAQPEHGKAATATYLLRWRAPTDVDRAYDLIERLRGRYEIVSITIEN